MLEGFNSDINGIGNSEIITNSVANEAVFYQTTNNQVSSKGNAFKQQIGKALILNSFPSFEYSQEEIIFRTTFYETLKSEWDEAGLQTTLKTSVTVADYKKISDYNVVMFSTHGNYYNNTPCICLSESVPKAKNKSYSDYLKAGSTSLITVPTKVANKATTVYWIIPAFFKFSSRIEHKKTTLIFRSSVVFQYYFVLRFLKRQDDSAYPRLFYQK